MDKREQVGVTRKLIQFVWLIFGVVEGLIGLRFVLKLLGANPESPFAAFVYQITEPFLLPFQALVATPELGQVELETTAIIAMIAYALLAWVMVKLVRIIFLPTTTEPTPEERMEEKIEEEQAEERRREDIS